MINKFKNIARRGISLLLAVGMMAPTGAYAATHSVTDWTGYRDKLKSDIMKQDTDITINFSSGEIFGTGETAQRKILDEYNDVMADVPRQYGDTNISRISINPKITKISETSHELESVTFNLVYYNNIASIKSGLNSKMLEIKSKTTAYGKIKMAYDYVLDRLKFSSSSTQHNIESENPVSSRAYSILFSIIMEELGYENVIVNGTIKKTPVDHKWNLVKVQGNWYHVDTSLGDIVSEGSKYDYLLTSDDIMTAEANYSHKWTSDVLANGKVAGTPYDSGKDLEYEINFIKTGILESSNKLVDNIDSIDNRISSISNIEGISLLQGEINIKNEKITGYENSIEVLSELAGIGDQLDEIESHLATLKSYRDNVTQKLLVKKATILVEIAEGSMSSGDIAVADSSVEVLAEGDDKVALNDRLIEIDDKLKAKVAVEKAEISRIQADVDKAEAAIANVDDGEFKNGLSTRLAVIKDEIDANTTEQGLINAATAAVDAAEAALKNTESTIMHIEGLISTAKTEIAKVKTETIKKQLENRIGNVEVAKDAIKSVNDVRSIISDTVTALDLETAIKAAEAAIKTIKDTSVKAAQLARIKEFKIVLAAIKAVEKAENTVPQKTTYVTSAKTAIAKITNSEYTVVGGLRDSLIARADKVNSSIAVTDSVTKAIKAVEKAENSMKDIDIASAKTSILILESLDVPAIKDDLNKRIDAAEKTVLADKILTKYMADPTIENSNALEAAITSAKSAIALLVDGTIKTLRNSRILVLENAKKAVEAVEKVDAVDSTEADKTAAEAAIGLVADSNIKKQLESKLKAILSKLDSKKKLDAANTAVKASEESLKSTDSIDINKTSVATAEAAVKILGSGTDKTKLQTIIKTLNNAIKAKEAVEKAEAKVNFNTLAAKDITDAEKAIAVYRASTTDDSYIPGLVDRIADLKVTLEINIAEKLLNDALTAVEKAKGSRTTKDIATAWKAIALVKSEIDKENLINELNILELDIATNAVMMAESSAVGNSTTLSKDITAAKKSVEAITSTVVQLEDINKLNTRINALNSYVATTKIVASATKNMTSTNKDVADGALLAFENEIAKVSDLDIRSKVYDVLVGYIKTEIDKIATHLTNEAQKLATANKAIVDAEEKMGIGKDDSPANSLIIAAQDAVNNVSDKIKKAEFQKRIDAIKAAIAAKLAVEMAEAYIDATTVKAAEKALSDLVKTGLYQTIISDLNIKIGKLKDQLNIKKLVEEATKLVQKAVESRKITDSIVARVAVEGIKEYVYEGNPVDLSNPYVNLKSILDNLDESINNEEADETAAVTRARDAIDTAVAIITGGLDVDGNYVDGVNVDIQKIIDPASEKGRVDIIAAYGRIQDAKNQIIIANAAVKKLTDQKDLLLEIKGANNEIELAEDNLDVKEAIRLVTIASNAVLSANTEEAKALAKLDISKARLAINKITLSENKDIKATITNTINSIENKLTSDNDQHLIDNAVAAVNEAADRLSEALSKSEQEVKDKRKDIEQAIFAARLAISWISENNKSPKDTLTLFIDGIDASFKAVIDGVDNGIRIIAAEAAVVLAEKYEGSNKDEKNGLIMAARIKVSVIQNLNADTKAKIDELNLRLDILEGKTGGGSDNGGGTGSGGNNSGGNNSGGNNSGGNSNGASPIGGSGGNIIISTPLPDRDREKGPSDPKWGKTKELKKANPSTN